MLKLSAALALAMIPLLLVASCAIAFALTAGGDPCRYSVNDDDAYAACVQSRPAKQ